MKVAHGRILLTMLVIILPSLASATEMEAAVGWSVDAGPVLSDSVGVSLSTNGTFLFLSGAVDFSHYWSGDESDKVRAYVGGGLGPAVQLQLGMGEGGVSGRIRTSLSLRRLFESGSLIRAWGEGYPGFDPPGSWFNRGWVLSGFAELNSDKHTTLGVTIGFLLI